MNVLMVLAGFLYEAFSGTFFIATGGGIMVCLSVLFARLLRDNRYWVCSRIYAKATIVLFALSSLILILAIVLADSLNPVPEIILPYLFSVWSIPLTITLVLIFISVGLMFLQLRTIASVDPSNLPFGLSTLLAILGAFAGCIALLFYNLTNTFMIAPSVPQSLVVVVQAGRLDPLTQLGLMVNRSWIPLTIKLYLVGSLAFSSLFSGGAALRRIHRIGSEEQRKWFDFVASWGFKTAILFGAPIGIIGYWNASILHTTVPTLALGLMGIVSAGESASLVSGLSPLWDIGIALSMSLGAIAGVYYLSRGRGRIRGGSGEQRVLLAFLPWLLILLVLATYAVLYVGEWYPLQFVLAFAVLIDGVFLFEAMRRYALGRVRLYVPALIFIASCYGLLLYQAPYTLWFNAAAFGGVSWPLIGFPLLAVTLYYFATRWREMRYWIPVTVGAIALLIIVLKMADVELVKGTTIVALDPGTRTVVQDWAYLNSYDLSFLYQQYPDPSNFELLSFLVFSLAYFLGVYAWIARIVSPAHRSLGPERQAESGVVV